MITAATLGQVRGLRANTFTHTYTWIQRQGSQIDPEGGTIPAWGVPVPGKACHLLPQEIVRVDPSGAALEVEAPRLIVAWNDPITDGDAVRDVHDADGNVLLVGPAAVMNGTAQVSSDKITHKVMMLSFERPQSQPVVP